METGNLRSELPILSKKFGSEYFNRLYRDGDKSPQGKIETYLSLIKRSLPDVHRGDSLLDIGCGYGSFLKAAETEFETYGIDPSEFAIAQARKYAINTKFEVTTISSYTPKKPFDVITVFDVLEHTWDPDTSLRRINNWMKPRGILVCVVPVYDGLLGWVTGKLDKDETHINKWSRDKWFGQFAKYFKTLEVWGAVRYSFGRFGYFHFAAPWLAGWGQAILVVMRK